MGWGSDKESKHGSKPRLERKLVKFLADQYSETLSTLTPVERLSVPLKNFSRQPKESLRLKRTCAHAPPLSEDIFSALLNNRYIDFRHLLQHHGDSTVSVTTEGERISAGTDWAQGINSSSLTEGS